MATLISGSTNIYTLGAVNSTEFKAIWGTLAQPANTNYAWSSSTGVIWNYSNFSTPPKDRMTFVYIYNNTSGSNISANITMFIDDAVSIYLNELSIQSYTSWLFAPRENISVTLVPGNNVFKFLCTNTGGAAGLAVQCNLINSTSILFATPATSNSPYSANWSYQSGGYLYKGSQIMPFIKYITDESVSNAFGNSMFSLNTTYVSDFTSTIVEKIENTSYTYKDTDISTYCIAQYEEGTATTSLTIPSWCNKVRLLLVGGGGKGGTGQAATIANQYDHDRDYSGGTHYHSHQHQYSTGQTGGGGGGGGFCYITTTVSSSSTAQFSIGGPGQSSTVTIAGTTYVANCGSSGSSTNNTGGSGGGYQTTGSSGSSGSNQTGGNAGMYQYISSNSSQKNTLVQYGTGGNGGVGGTGTQYAMYASGPAANPGSAGNDGKGGYYRIYYYSVL